MTITSPWEWDAERSADTEPKAHTVFCVSYFSSVFAVVLHESQPAVKHRCCTRVTPFIPLQSLYVCSPLFFSWLCFCFVLFNAPIKVMECVFLPLRRKWPVPCYRSVPRHFKVCSTWINSSWQLLFDDYGPDTKAVTIHVPQRTRGFNGSLACWQWRPWPFQFPMASFLFQHFNLKDPSVFRVSSIQLERRTVTRKKDASMIHNVDFTP